MGGRRAAAGSIHETMVSNSAKFIKRIALRVELQYNLKAGHGKNAA
jgi:hypothetical protein